MNKYLQRILPFFALTILFSSCKKNFDDYYARPAGLEQPIYQVLDSKGNFKSMLALIDKAGYKVILGSAGYWTMFAPNDAAFTKFYTERGTSIDKIDSATARAIVQYLLVYNAFNKDRIDDYQSNTGWIPDQAFRRRTAYYTGFYNDTLVNGSIVKSVASNRNGTTYVAADNNNKYIPYFTDIYFNGRGLTAADYNYFYPSSEYSGFNVADAKVLNKDIAAENGVIHEIDRVITPLPSIDEYLRSKPEYSEFKKLYEKYMVGFFLNADATSKYKLLTGASDQVYVKTYNSSLAFALNNENYFKLQDNDAQQNEWTLFVPKNDVLLKYLKDVILEFFGTFDGRTDVLTDFLNAHMWQTPVWPSKFSTTNNFVNEEARFNPQTDIIDRKILSNGIFYGTSKVQEANVFASVYGRAYLDPRFSLMKRVLDYELKFNITNPRQKVTLFLYSDATLAAAGYTYNSASNTWTYTPPAGVGGAALTGEAARQRILRIVNTNALNQDIVSLAGSGIAETYNGEFIKYTNNQVISVGTQDLNQVVKVDSVRISNNGRVYYLNGVLNFTDTTIGRHIVKLGGTSATTSDYFYFADFLKNSGAYNSANGEVLGTTAGTFYTVFAPSNAAIIQAVKDGFLPGNKTTGIPNTTAATQTNAEKDQVTRFIQYHFLAKRALIPESKESGPFETLLKNANGDVLPITVITTGPNIQVTDMNNRKSNILIDKSNNLSNRTIIHLIDNYLKFNY